MNTTLFKLKNKVKKSIQKTTGYNQIFEKENKKELARNIKNLIAYIDGMESAPKAE